MSFYPFLCAIMQMHCRVVSLYITTSIHCGNPCHALPDRPLRLSVNPATILCFMQQYTVQTRAISSLHRPMICTRWLAGTFVPSRSSAVLQDLLSTV